MVRTILKKSGDEFVVMAPTEEIERLGLEEGQEIEIDVQAVTTVPELSDPLSEAFEIEFRKSEEGLKYLKGVQSS